MKYRKSAEIVVKAMCLIKRNGKTLLNRGFDQAKNEIFYRLVGGTVEFGETGKKAIKREIKEELNSQLINLKFIKIIENIFVFNGQKGHEIVFIYKGDLTNKKIYQRKKIYFFDEGKKYLSEWISIDRILKKKIILYPLLNYKKFLA